MDWTQYLATWWSAVPVLALIALVIWVRWGFKALVAKLFGLFGWLVFVVLWAMPAVLMVVGLIMPSFHDAVSLPLPEKVVRGIVILIVPFVGGIVVSILGNFLAAKKSALMLNVSAAGVWALITTGIVSYNAGSGTLAYWAMMPMFYSLIDLFMGIVMSIQNAWQKSPMQTERMGAAT